MHHFSDKLTNNRFRRHQLETTPACTRTVEVQITSYLQLIPAWEGKNGVILGILITLLDNLMLKGSCPTQNWLCVFILCFSSFFLVFSLSLSSLSLSPSPSQSLSILLWTSTFLRERKRMKWGAERVCKGGVEEGENMT